MMDHEWDRLERIARFVCSVWWGIKHGPGNVGTAVKTLWDRSA